MRGCAVIVSVLVLLLAAHAAAQEPTVVVTGYTVTPEVLMPGGQGTIAVNLTNTAGQATQTETDTSTGTGTGTRTETRSTAINAFIESVYLKGEGLKVISGDYGDVGEVGPGQSVTLTFLVQAPEEEGLYFPEVWVRVPGARGVTYPVPVNVNSRYALIAQPAISVVRAAPDRVVPGETFSLSLLLENTGLSRANDLSVQVSPSNATSIVSLSPEHYYVEQLEPGGAVRFNLSFATDRKTPTGLQVIPVSLTYFTPDAAKVSRTESVGVQVTGQAEMGIASLSTDPVRPSAGSPFTLVLRIENTGTDDATSVRATVDLPFEGTKEAFVGTIEPDNDAPAVFNLRAGEAGDRPYTLTVAWRDDRGEHTMTEALGISVEAPDRTPLVVGAFVLIAAAVVAVWWLRRRKEE
ncbi:COG1361 S-layer family protein [Methanofollis ethanolicus]|uniref:COG1361 S-layer family protein n=1 Tax=Methanofollis ethanolicus TaxID=488124 RepID=UPI00083768CA|nr:hypothetical protein [Methanofollis ethanolicus]